MTISQNTNNKLQIKLCKIPKNKSRQNETKIRFNHLNKLNYTLSNKYSLNNKALSLNFNNSNYQILHTSEFNVKDTLEKHNIKSSANILINYYKSKN